MWIYSRRFCEALTLTSFLVARPWQVARTVISQGSKALADFFYLFNGEVGHLGHKFIRVFVF